MNRLGSTLINYSNYCQKHFSAHCLPDPAHSAFRIFFCLIAAITMFGGMYFYPHFIDHAAEARRPALAQTGLSARGHQNNLRAIPAKSG